VRLRSHAQSAVVCLAVNPSAGHQVGGRIRNLALRASAHTCSPYSVLAWGVGSVRGHRVPLRPRSRSELRTGGCCSWMSCTTAFRRSSGSTAARCTAWRGCACRRMLSVPAATVWGRARPQPAATRWRAARPATAAWSSCLLPRTRANARLQAAGALLRQRAARRRMQGGPTARAAGRRRRQRAARWRARARCPVGPVRSRRLRGRASERTGTRRRGPPRAAGRPRQARRPGRAAPPTPAPRGRSWQAAAATAACTCTRCTRPAGRRPGGLGRRRPRWTESAPSRCPSRRRA
jgi:hypothetical protein